MPSLRGILAPSTLLLLTVGPGAWGAGQAVGLKHPVLQHDVDPARAAQYEEAVKRVMAMREEDLLRFVPPYGYASYCECPNCYGGVEGNNIFQWSIDRPDELKCRFCGTVVFPNPNYPESQFLTGENRLGETIRLPYYLHPEKGIEHFFTLNRYLYQRKWLLAQCLALGKAYQATGKGEYARRVAMVLDRIATAYPHYPVLQNYPRRLRFRESQEPPWPWDSGRWGYFHNEIPTEVILCYDLIYDSDELDRLSRERGYDVRERIERDFLIPTFEAVAAQKNHVSNVVGYDVRSAALLGRVMNEPRMVHWAFGWMKENVNAGFMADGMWHEAPSYHYMTVGGLRYAFESVRGYSDPPGYRDPVTGARFDNLDPEREVPFWEKVQRAPEVIGFPNGWLNPVHDTHPYERRAQPRARTVSTICPAYGHASLGRGTGSDQLMAQLHFSGGYGHAHQDSLNLTLWAKEREMLPDLGYTWTQMRTWTTCTLSHNTVVVNRRNQRTHDSDGDLLAFFPDAGGIGAVEADGRRAYADIDGLDVYRRLLVTVPVSESDAYVVDLFRVRGGAIHDWALHGDADEDTTASCTLPLGEARALMLEPGEKWDEPTIEGAKHHPYGMVRDARPADAADGFRIDFTYMKDPNRGLRVHLVGGLPAQAWLGRSPSVRRMGQGRAGDMRKAYDFWMPQLLVRRTGQSPLASTFAAVHEPYAGRPFLESVTPLAFGNDAEFAVALQVRHGDIVDTILSTDGAPPFPERTTPTGIRMAGRLGIVREQAGRVIAAWLFDGTSLSGKGWELRSEAALAGTLTGAMRKADGAAVDAFLTEADLPAGEALKGAWMIVTHGSGHRHGYCIERVEPQGGKSMVVLSEDHGLRIEGARTREVFYPRREFEGLNTFRIPRVSRLTR
jgi:hypothetical protein